MGEDEIVRLFNAKIKLERKQYKKRVLQLAPERIYQRAYQINCRENIAETLLEKSSEMKSEVLRCLLVLPNVIQFFMPGGWEKEIPSSWKTAWIPGSRKLACSWSRKKRRRHEEKSHVCTYGAGKGRLRIIRRERWKHKYYNNGGGCRFCSLFFRRGGELRALQWSDIDFENKIIHVNGTLKYIAKAKVKYMIDEPKSESSKRDILMLDNLVTVLREHRKRQLATRMLLGDKWRPELGFENLVFTGGFGRCISETALYEDMKKIRTQIREDGHAFGAHTPHSLRHTFATRGFEKGIPPKVMQEILGHKSITMTLDIYSHVLPDKKAEEINKLAAMF